MRLRYAADLRSLGFVAVYWGLLAFQWVVEPRRYALAGLLLVLTCVMSFLCAVITHNAIHSPLFRARSANRVLQVILSLSYGSAVSAFVSGHNLSHHRHTQSPRDVMRTTKVRHASNLVNILEFVVKVGIAIARNDLEYAKAMRARHGVWYRQYRIENYAVWLATGLLLLVDWRKGLLYWVAPHLYAAWGIISMNYLQHDGCDIEHPYNHSRNFVGKIVNWWTFNNGYHGLHHDRPGLHWSLLPAEHRRLYSPFVAPELEQKSLLVYLFKTFVWPGRRVTFDGKPVVLPPPTPDESWIPRPEETPGDLGAVTVG
jgi:fatty acid desaturase